MNKTTSAEKKSLMKKSMFLRWMLIVGMLLLTIVAILLILYLVNRENNKKLKVQSYEKLYITLNNDSIELAVATANDTTIKWNDYIKDYSVGTLTINDDKCDASKISNCVVTITITDKYNQSKTKKLNVSIVDKVAPVIELTQYDISIDVGSTIDFTSYIKSTTDNYDGSLLEKVQIDEGDFKKDIAGSYEIKYKVEDTSCNISIAILKVIVNKKVESSKSSESNNSTKNNNANNSSNGNNKNSRDKSSDKSSDKNGNNSNNQSNSNNSEKTNCSSLPKWQYCDQATCLSVGKEIAQSDYVRWANVTCLHMGDIYYLYIYDTTLGKDVLIK